MPLDIKSSDMEKIVTSKDDVIAFLNVYVLDAVKTARAQLKPATFSAGHEQRGNRGWHVPPPDGYSLRDRPVEMRTLCRFDDTCPEFNEVLLNPITDSRR
jgi:hypothetical protein